jgi:hypothetical protein
MESFVADVRYAVRLLIKTPTYTAVAVATLALGIGANAAIFSVLDGVMLRPLPYPDIDRIVIISEQVRGGQRLSVSWPNYHSEASPSCWPSLESTVCCRMSSRSGRGKSGFGWRSGRHAPTCRS